MGLSPLWYKGSENHKDNPINPSFNVNGQIRLTPKIALVNLDFTIKNKHDFSLFRLKITLTTNHNSEILCGEQKISRTKVSPNKGFILFFDFLSFISDMDARIRVHYIMLK